MSSLDDLAQCMRGAAPPGVEWRRVLDLANRSLIVASLALALEGTAIPDDVRDFLADVLRRNKRRNAALTEQLGEAVRALNEAGITPGLIKGSAGLATGRCGWREGRILCDLDILVRPSEVQRAILALEQRGYRLFGRRHEPDAHAVADLGREGDWGMIDLHQRPPGPPGMAEPPGLRERARDVAFGGGAAWIPDPAAQLYLLMMHDQFHDGDYWSGRLNLRHLLDAHALIAGRDGMDWPALEEMIRSPLTRNALDSFLVGVAWLTGCRIPASRGRRLTARLQHARRRLQVVLPWTMWPLACATTLWEAPNILAHRRVDRGDRERLFGGTDALPNPGSRIATRLERMKDIFAPPATGKL